MKSTNDEKDALDLISESVGTLACYHRASEDAFSMEELLNHIFKTEMIRRSPDSYSYDVENRDSLKLGTVWIGRANNPDEHCMDVSFCPNPKFQEQVRYIQKIIGVIDLSKKTYGLRSRDSNDPDKLYFDVRQVLNSWGLKRAGFKRSLE